MKARYILGIIFCIFLIGEGTAQTDRNEALNLEDTVLYYDSLFWLSYNSCNLEKLKTFFSDDLEFYHDKGGVTTNLSNFMQSLSQGICAHNGTRMRREAVKGTIRVYPIQDYGALITGDHLFYRLQTGNKEVLDGQAKFVHLWHLTKNKWQMTRVFSFAHAPMDFGKSKKAVSLSETQLEQFVGSYKSSLTGEVLISRNKDQLSLKSGDFEVLIYPESESNFFIHERDIEFRFIRNADGMISKMLILENSEIVDQAEKTDR
ncbi:MAG: DUF4440 domain-containing protein [Saprospiraceae bacterium]|nr:DUF4440 domain-containing protein [Saprospiraceae bacterium]